MSPPPLPPSASTVLAPPCPSWTSISRSSPPIAAMRCMRADISSIIRDLRPRNASMSGPTRPSVLLAVVLLPISLISWMKPSLQLGQVTS
ncbi:hypothetical protein E2562_006289 [Oryza meyeriana var. granulata]|uniref:Uncharacterized protein n=1 Tax=Oryza meyeriana var. granulata TaxID=110450 RepID=A0A6G1EE51_9ORYZ|nr:hypothetical protein E2562_006289 [Oryza meyeriana var. granulata]